MKNLNDLLTFQCDKGHTWTARPNIIIHDSWCPECFQLRRRVSMEEIQKIAAARGGRCLTPASEYNNYKQKLLWECKHGHRWQANLSNIKANKRWCPECSRNRKLTITDMVKEAAKYDGECLSEEYVNNSTKLTWKCKNGHVWQAVPLSIRNGSWCPYCRRGWTKPFSGKNPHALTIEDMKNLAAKYDGICLATEYKNARTKLRWQCSQGHIWTAFPYAVKTGKWCPECANQQRRLGLEIMQKAAESFGGKCLSKSYKNSGTKLTWQCKERHVFQATYDSVRDGHWCPKCFSIKIKKSDHAL